MNVIQQTLTSLAIIITITSPLQAGEHKGDKFCKHHGKSYSKHVAMAEQLSLTDEQKKKIASLRKHKMKIMKSIREEMFAIQSEFFQLDPQAPGYKAKVFELADKKGLLVKRMIVEKGEMRFLVTSLFTPEQLAKRKELFSAPAATTNTKKAETSEEKPEVKAKKEAKTETK